MHSIKVLLPHWWCKRPVYGYTDGEVSYLMGVKCYLVTVPEYDYSGYFPVASLRVVAAY